VTQLEKRIEKIEEVLLKDGETRLVNQKEVDCLSKKIGTSLKMDMDSSFKKIRDEIIEVTTKKKRNDLKADMDRAFLKIKAELTEANVGLAEMKIGERREEEVFTQLQKNMGEMKKKWKVMWFTLTTTLRKPWRLNDESLILLILFFRAYQRLMQNRT
jgi:hypothetical protein